MRQAQTIQAPVVAFEGFDPIFHRPRLEGLAVLGQMESVRFFTEGTRPGLRSRLFGGLDLGLAVYLAKG